MSRRMLILAEREQGCRDRLVAAGFDPAVAGEVAGYLSQATDLVVFDEPIRQALAATGLAVRFGDPADPAEWLDWLREDPAATLVWPVTDGIRYYRGSGAAAVARLLGARSFGAPAQIQHLAQDKAKCGAVAAALGIRVPATGLMRDGRWLTPPPAGRGVAEQGSAGQGPWFVKPNTLGAKLGIWGDSRVDDLEQAAVLSRRIHARYRDDAVVQAYVPGFDVRVSYMAVDPDPALDRIGVYRLDTGGRGEAGGDFMTMADNRTLSGTADFVPRMVALAATAPALATGIADSARRLAAGVGLRDVFSIDMRVSSDGLAHLLEFEVCPAVTIYDFRRYLADHWGCDLPEAVARAASHAFGRPADL